MYSLCKWRLSGELVLLVIMNMIVIRVIHSWVLALKRTGYMIYNEVVKWQHPSYAGEINYSWIYFLFSEES